MSARFWQTVAAATWMSVLLVAALTLAQSCATYRVWQSPPPKAPVGLDLPSASPLTRPGDAERGFK
jgi:hypothetical protein